MSVCHKKNACKYFFDEDVGIDEIKNLLGMFMKNKGGIPLYIICQRKSCVIMLK